MHCIVVCITYSMTYTTYLLICMFFFSQLVMDPERHFRESQDNISNVGEHHIQKKRKARGTTLMLELTKNWDGNVITVEYDQKGRPTPQEVRRKIAGYEGALARVMVPLNAVSDWRKLKDLREGQLERDLWDTMKVNKYVISCYFWKTLE